jgi:hypothetical protein
MIDILFPVYKREAFTHAALAALRRNTDPALANVIVHEDWRNEGPVAVMSRYLSKDGPAIFAKIDNDTIVPPGWLTAALAVMAAHPELGLLGIEPPASRTPAPWMAGFRHDAPEHKVTDPSRSGYATCDMIGGIGLMRRSAFASIADDPMIPHAHNGVGGFSDWQRRHPEVIKGWITPPLNVFLLDRLPIEPWATMSKTYIARGWQRPWTNYAAADSALWDWWLKDMAVAA